MINVTAGTFAGMECLWLSNGTVKLAVTTQRGPRIVFWGWEGGENLFVEAPDARLASPNGPYSLLGGHRLWYAPEVLSTTYYPDDAAPDVQVAEGSATFTSSPDGQGIVKSIAVSLSGGEPEASITHSLLNSGNAAVRLAPWAISMCRVGGLAMLPQPVLKADPDGVLPNRHLSLWPYTDINDPRLRLGNRLITIQAEPGPNNKIGYRSAHGWLTYRLDKTVFSKRIDPSLPGDYPDGGCNAEIFFSTGVIEVETLGPFVDLQPGASTTHHEAWTLYRAQGQAATEAEAEALAAGFGLVI